VVGKLEGGEVNTMTVSDPTRCHCLYGKPRQADFFRRDGDQVSSTEYGSSDLIPGMDGRVYEK
jgi:hypothetical protein